MRSLLRFATVPVLLSLLMLLTVAASPAAPAQPAQPAVVATSNAGEIAISWTPASGAQFYTVGWINRGEFEDMRAAGRDWQDAFHYATIPATYTSHTVSGLKQGGEYFGIVGARTSRFGGESPVWSSWSTQVTTAGQHGEGFCPVTGLPLPPTGYLSIGDTATFGNKPEWWIDITLDSATTPSSIEQDDGSTFTAPAGLKLLNLCVTVANGIGTGDQIYFQAGTHNNLSTDNGIGFIRVYGWQNYALDDGFQATGCDAWTVPADATSAVYAVNYVGDPQLFQIPLP